MKDTYKCCKESKMKVKNEENSAIAQEKDNQTPFEKKNNLSGDMTKEEQTEIPNAVEKGDNLEKEPMKNQSDEAIDNLTDQVNEITISSDLKDVTNKISGIQISEHQTDTVQREILEEDGKRRRSPSESENDSGTQKRENDLITRGPNGGVPRNSFDNYNVNCFSQPERKPYSCNKRTFNDESEPHKYIRPVDQYNLTEMPQMMTFQNQHTFVGGTVNIKTPSPCIQPNEGLNPFDFNDKLIDISSIVDSQPFPNLQDFNIDPMNNIQVNNNMYTQVHKEENIMEEHSPYGNPPSNQSDSGVSGMSFDSPYHDPNSPQSVMSHPSPQSVTSQPSPPHEFNGNMPDIQGGFPQQTKKYMGGNLSNADFFSGRERELEDAESIIFGDLSKDNSKKSNQSEVPISIPKQVMSPNLALTQSTQQFNQPINQRPICTMATHNSMPQPVTVFGQQQIGSKQIILPPPTQPSAVVRPINTLGNPVMIPQGCPIPIGQMPSYTGTPYTQPQIIIIQPAPVQAVKKPGFRNIAPKTEKPVGKKPAGSPGENKDGGQKQAIRTEAVPVMTVKPTPTPACTPQRSTPNNMTNAQTKNRKLNVARRMVAEIPSAQIQQQDEEGDTYLHVAACKSDPGMVQAILERLNREKMDWLIDWENKNRMTPLYLAVLGNQPEIVEIFLNHGADPNMLAQSISSDGKSMEVKAPIHVAAAGGEDSLSTLKKLLSVRDISLNIYNSEGHTALHTAIIAHGTRRSSTGSYINSLNTIEALIKAGAESNSQDKKSGKTPLMYAIEKRDCILIEKMLRQFDPKKLRNVVKSQTFDGSNCLKIAEGRKSEFDPQTWQKLWDLLNKACTGELPKTSLIIGGY